MDLHEGLERGDGPLDELARLAPQDLVACHDVPGGRDLKRRIREGFFQPSVEPGLGLAEQASGLVGVAEPMMGHRQHEEHPFVRRRLGQRLDGLREPTRPVIGQAEVILRP